MTDEARARERVERLGLVPHPEGGYFAEIFRSSDEVRPADGRGPRAALTVIHFLVPAGRHSRWHAVRSDEQWTWLEGDPLELLVVDPGTRVLRTIRLGPSASGATPTWVVPAGAWQAARARSGFALVTCTVGPGFDFADFRMLADDPESRRVLVDLGPEAADLL